MGYSKIRCVLSVEAKFQSAELVSITQAIITKVSQLFHNHAILSFSRFTIMPMLSVKRSTIMQCSQSAVSQSCSALSQLFYNHAMLAVSWFTIMQCSQSTVSKSCNVGSQLFPDHAMLPVSCFQITQCSQSAVSKSRNARFFGERYP